MARKINDAITQEEMKEIFFVEGNEEAFNTIFDQEEYTEFGIISRIKPWLEFLGFVGDYTHYFEMTHKAKKFMNEELIEFKNGLNDIGLDIIHLFSVKQFFFNFNDKTNLTNGEGFNREFNLESDLKNSLYESLKNMSDEWVIRKERIINHGKCDLLITDDTGFNIAIELKKGAAKRKDIYQTVEYKGGNTEAVIIAKSFSDDVLSLAKDLNIKCYYYSMETGLIPQFVFIGECENQKSFVFDDILQTTYENDGVYIKYPFFNDLDDLNNYIRKFTEKENRIMELIKGYLYKKMKNQKFRKELTNEPCIGKD